MGLLVRYEHKKSEGNHPLTKSQTKIWATALIMASQIYDNLSEKQCKSLHCAAFLQKIIKNLSDSLVCMFFHNGNIIKDWPVFLHGLADAILQC